MFQFSSGKILGRYELLVPVARGGMADVWAARLHGSRGFTKLVAIKTIRTGSLDDTRLEQMLLTEANLASQIQHPNVVSTLELGEQDESLFLVMEWADAEPLSHLLKEPFEVSSLPLPIAINIVAQACRGAHAAHELRDVDGNPLGVVHRDLSPHNVLVTYQGIVKLVDFGIAKATQQASSMTQDGEVKGKLAYMSPEQVRGEAVDRRTDVFALGTILYLMTTGQHPFKCPTPGETLTKLLSEAPVLPPSRFVADFPEALAEILQRALHKDREGRFATADELRVALEAAFPEARGIENQVAEFLNENSGGKGDLRRRHIRAAGELLDRNLDLSQAPRSSTSMSAMSLGNSGTLSVQGLPMPTEPPPPVRHRVLKHWPLALGACAAVGALLAFTLREEAPQPLPSTAAPGEIPGALMSAASASAPVPAEPPVAEPSATAPEAEASESEERPASGKARVRERTARVARPAAPAAPAQSSTASETAAPAETQEPAQRAPKPGNKQKKRDSWDPSTFGGRL